MRTITPRRTRRTRLLSMLAAAAISAGGIVALAAPAEAAMHVCNGMENFDQMSSQYVVSYPAWMDGVDSGFDCYVKRGMADYPKGNVAGIAALQRALNQCYGAGLTVDGSFGPATEAAVRRVQTLEKITVDGVFGPTTKYSMKWPISGPGYVTGKSCWERW